MPNQLDGRRILILEDDFLAALDMSQMVEGWGGTVIGPVSRLDQALALARAQELDGAILDVRLDGCFSFPAADELMARRVPVVFVTGYEMEMLPERFAGTPRLAKPLSELSGGKTFCKVFGGRASGPAGPTGGSR